MKQIGIVLHNLGGPTSLDAIRPFLTNLFLDPEIIRIPLPKPFDRLFPRTLFAWFVARRRTPKVRPNYEAIGGRSPLNDRSEEQARALENELNERFNGIARFHVRLGMRYWHPFTRVAMDEFEKLGIRDVFLLPLYPQYSRTTSGSSFKEWRDLHRTAFAKRFRVKAAKDYHLHPRFIAAINERIDATLRDRFSDDERANVNLLFSAHGTPMSEVYAGDPYSHQIRATVRAVMDARGNDLAYHESFQSRVGPVKWLEPYTQDKLAELGAKGVRTLLVVPVAFVTDHIETLHELDIELREVAEHAGITKYEVMYALNDGAGFIGALADVVQARYAIDLMRANDVATMETHA
ncbi:MAG: ferrochelatase [bacterium]|nr:ferrochelatase [Candidatus Kapabacteria bacterium]